MKKNDKLIALIISILTLSLGTASFVSYDFFSWAFERHRNILSWYVQLFLIVPFCFFAFKKSFTGIAACVFLFVTSTFWFPVPDNTHPFVLSFLYLKADWIYGSWFLEKFIVTLILLAIFSGLTIALWKRRLDIGVLTMFLLCIEKLVWEFFFSLDKFSLSGIIFAIISSAIGLTYAFFASRKKITGEVKGDIKKLLKP